MPERLYAKGANSTHGAKAIKAGWGNPGPPDYSTTQAAE